MKRLLISALALVFFQFNPWSATTDQYVIMWDAVNARFNNNPVYASPDIIAIYNRRRNFLRIANGSTTTDGYGYQNTTDAGTASAQAADSTNPVRIRQTSAASTGSRAGLETDHFINRTGRNVRIQTWAGVVTATTTERVWIALTDQSATTMVASDNPAGNYAGFRYSTDASDTAWVCITKDNSTQATSGSGISIDTNGHYFEVRENVANSSYDFYIDNAPVCSIATHLPASGTNLKPVVELATRANSARAIDVGWIYTESDK